MSDENESTMHLAAPWHLAEADRLLRRVKDLDDNLDQELAGKPDSVKSNRRWSYIERARAHTDLARELRESAQ